METIVLLALAFIMGAGELNKQEVEYTPSNIEEVQDLYNPSATRLSDIVHTNLSVRFRLGEAILAWDSRNNSKAIFPRHQRIDTRRKRI